MWVERCVLYSLVDAASPLRVADIYISLSLVSELEGTVRQMESDSEDWIVLNSVMYFRTGDVGELAACMQAGKAELGRKARTITPPVERLHLATCV